MESRPSRNSTAYPRPPRRGLYECCTAIHKKHSQPGDGVSALSLQLSRRSWCQACEGSQDGRLASSVTRLKLIGTAVMRYTYCTWPLIASCPKHFILIVRLPLPTMLLTSSPLSLILTLTLVRPASFLFPLWGAYRDCFHVFLSLCVFLGFTRGGLVTHNLSSLPGLAFFVIS
jgi:hypothetical protein